MSLYVHPENQTLLWNTIQKMPQFHTSPVQKEQWFSNIIRQFYEQNQHKNMTKTDLQILNRQTIAYMVEDLQKYVQTNPPITSAPLTKIVDAFASRQYEYESLNKPKEPPVANFGEKIDDEVITNMDELLQQQIKQREYDIARAKEQMPAPPTEIILPSKSKDNELQELRNQVSELTKMMETIFAKIEGLEKNYLIPKDT
jgi:hypothetical protein